MTSCVVSFFFLVSLISSNSATSPTGLKLRITERGKDVLKQLGLTYLEELVNKPFGDFSKYISSLLTNIAVKGLTITQLLTDPAEVDLRFQQGVGLQFEIMNLGIDVKLERELNLAFFNLLSPSFGQGPTTFSAEGMNAAIVVRLTRTSAGGLNAEIRNDECNVKADNIKIKFDGNLRRALSLLEQQIVSTFYSEICPFLQSKINENLEKLPMVWNVHEDRRLHLDYSVSRDVTVTSRSLDLSFKGLVSVEGQDEQTGLVGADKEIIFTETDHMIDVGVSEFFFNSAASSIYKSGPFNLDVPQVESVFGKSVLKALGLPPGHLNLELTEAPTIKISKAGLSTNVNITTQSGAEGEVFYVACQLDMKVDFQGIQLILVLKEIKCDVKSKKITGNMSIADSVLSLDFMDKWFNFRKPLPLPLPLPVELNLLRAKVQYEDGYLVAGGSLAVTLL